jgi:hypothetical protein
MFDLFRDFNMRGPMLNSILATNLQLSLKGLEGVLGFHRCLGMKRSPDSRRAIQTNRVRLIISKESLGIYPVGV